MKGMGRRFLLAGVAAALAATAAGDSILSRLPFLSKGPGFDFNGDGSVRIAVLSPAVHAGGINAAVWATDLEGILKASVKCPVRVGLVPLGKYRSMMGWWYAPDTDIEREKLVNGQTDLLLLAEHEEIVKRYPEFFFEGVRCVAALARANGVKTALVMMSSPRATHRDKLPDSTAEIVYRVGAGCGIEVIPAGYGWKQALFHNRMPGDSPQKARCGAFLAAAAVYSQYSGEAVRKAGLEVFWTTAKTAGALAESALEAVRQERIRRHYSKPFAGVVATGQRLSPDMKVYQAAAPDSDPVLPNLKALLQTANLRLFSRSVADWYTDGVDRFWVPFDLVYGDRQQIKQYLDRSVYTTPYTGEAFKPCVAVFSRLPEGLSKTDDILLRLETLLFDGYDFARENKLVYIPYPLAWARACAADPAMVATSDPARRNDWLSYMLANMLYAACTGRFQPPSEQPKPHYANSIHPASYHARCARIGYDTMIQLSGLSEANNALLVRNDFSRTAAGQPGFAGVRLLDRPAAPVKVLFAVDNPNEAALSCEEAEFTPENFDIEQTVRVTPLTGEANRFVQFMAGATSSDRAVDGKSDTRMLVLNFNESEPGGFEFSTRELSPKTGFSPGLKPSLRPTAILEVSVRQHGMETQRMVFAPEALDAQPLRAHPTLSDYRQGRLDVELAVKSEDLRYNGVTFRQEFQLNRGGQTLPGLKVTEPAPGTVIAGPAFVTAAAEAEFPRGVRRVSLWTGMKCLGSGEGPKCAAAIEVGPPQSRLAPGKYLVWAETETVDGVVLATKPMELEVSGAGAGEK